MILCKICHNLYSENRTHCPVCNAKDCGEKFFDGIIQIVVARGIERDKAMPYGRKSYKMVD